MTNFVNKEEIVKFQNLTHNQNTRVREHLLKEMTDTTSLTDMLRMGRVCEGTVHSEEMFKQYLDSVKTVKQVDAIHQWNSSKNKEAMEAIEARVITGPSLESLINIHVTIVAPVTLLVIARPMAKNVSIATSKAISPNTAI